MNKQLWSGISAVLLSVVLIAALTYIPLYERVNVLSTDVMLTARHLLYGQQHPAERSDVVIIAFDEQTYDTPPFAGVPKVLWTPHIAQVQDAVLSAGAKVIGYDVIFSTSLESFLPGYEKPYLLSLLKAARAGKVVLGKAQHADKPVAPHPAQSFVVQNQKNIRSLNIQVDSDDIIRRLPLFFDKANGGKEPSMAYELAARATGEPPISDAKGSWLGNYLIPGSERNAALINFQGGEDIPTYSLADLYACSQKDRRDYFQQHFKDKVVIFGGILDVEDRKITSKRYITDTGLGVQAPHCLIPTAKPSKQFSRETIPGVFIHATAVNNFLHQSFLQELPANTSRLVIVALALLSAALTVALKPTKSTLCLLLLVFACSWVGIEMIKGGVLIAFIPTVSAIALSYLLMSLYRYMIVDKQKSRIRNLFSLYLEPHLVDRMVETEHLPKLGGELREVTVWFSDLANFTELSEGLEATELVSLMNEYFTAVTDLIEDHGGFVDKYIGDAVVAIFGAPLDDPHHAGHAVAAALMVQDKLQKMNEAGAFGDRHISTRTGINTGMAVVGNVGSAKRFNYTVMGDTVNLASRLEGANKSTQTEILLSEEVVKKLPKSFVLREVATIRVKGKTEPTRVFEPLTVFSWRPARRVGNQTRYTKLRQPEPIVPDNFQRFSKLAVDFSLAQEYYRCRAFEQTIELMSLYPEDPAAEALLKRAEAKLKNPPPEDWDGIETLTEK